MVEKFIKKDAKKGHFNLINYTQGNVLQITVKFLNLEQVNLGRVVNC